MEALQKAVLGMLIGIGLMIIVSDLGIIFFSKAIEVPPAIINSSCECRVQCNSTELNFSSLELNRLSMQQLMNRITRFEEAANNMSTAQNLIALTANQAYQYSASSCESRISSFTFPTTTMYNEYLLFNAKPSGEYIYCVKSEECTVIDKACCPCPAGSVAAINKKWAERYRQELNCPKELGLYCGSRVHDCSYTASCIDEHCQLTHR